MRKVLKYSAELFMLKTNVTPIWTLNELYGKHSAVSMWSAGEFPFRELAPTYFEPFNRSIPWKQRIDNLMPALKRNESQIDLVMFYAEHPDFEAHAYSSQSKQVSHIGHAFFFFSPAMKFNNNYFNIFAFAQVFDVLNDMDRMVGYLSEQLNAYGLSEVTDIIIISDHGMDDYRFNRETIDDSIINLNRIVSEDSCDMYGSSPVLQVIARDGYNQTELCAKLKRAAELNGNYNVYTDGELELKEHWHILNEQRFGPCTVVANPGYVFQDMTDLLKKWTDYEKCKLFEMRKLHKFRRILIVFFTVAVIPGTKFGCHGYDNQSPKMQAVFVAHGPRFRSGIEIPSLQNVDLYYLFARLLNIEQYAAKLGLDAVDRQKIWNQMLK